MLAGPILLNTFRKFYQETRFLLMMIAPLVTVGSCSFPDKAEMCVYVNVRGEETSIESLQRQNAKKDAEELLSENRFVLIGGYTEHNGITSILYDGMRDSNDIDRVISSIGIEKVKNVYLTRRLNEISDGNLLSTNDGVIDGSQVDQHCYNEEVRQYSYEFNNAVIERVLSRSR